MTAIPEEVRRLVDEREAARRAKDFAVADALRARIRDAGFEVEDTAAGPRLHQVRQEPPPSVPPLLRTDQIVTVLDQPPPFEVSVHWLVEGWPDDVTRGIEAFGRHHPDRRVQHVVVDLVGTPPATWPPGTEVIRLGDDVGWAAARNAGILRAAGSIVLVVDGSIEPTGDVLGPVARALEDPSVGVTGSFGIVTDDLREFHEADGPDVDAVEGYLMAFRRDAFERGLRFDEKFRFYRTADIELSFQIKALGLRATVTPVPVRRHEHRMWTATPEDRRAALSKRNFYRFLDRWRGRFDLTVAGRRRGSS